MDKIKELLLQLGSEELADQIMESLDEWRAKEQEQLNEQLKEKLVKAKALYVEEVNKHKRTIARRVEIFLESKVAQVEREARGRQAIGESKAVNDLKQVKALLGGYTIDGIDEDLQALKDENVSLRSKVVAVTEDVTQVKKQYTRARSIAQKAIARNSILEDQARQGAISESKKNEGGTKLTQESTPSSKPKTNRATISESQQPARPSKPVQEGDDEIMRIASETEMDLV
jgi:hypothetical protein